MSATQYFNDQITNDKQISINGSGITLTKNLLTTPVTAHLTQNGIQVGLTSSSWENLSLLDEVLASVEYPPNPQTLKLNNTLMLNNGTDTTNVLDNTGILIDSPFIDFSKTEMNSYRTLITDYTTDNRLELNKNPLGMTLTDSQNNITTLYGNSKIEGNGMKEFELNNGNYFFKQFQPTSWNPVYLTNGQKIEPYHTFVCVETGSAPVLYPSSVYLDSNGNEGWSCFISNFYGDVITINNEDGIRMYSSATGETGGSIQLKKWATARFTLVKLPNLGDYAWAVSQF
jgi:hypothetical protein